MVEVEKTRSAGYPMPNGGCAFEYDLHDEVSTEEMGKVEAELVEVALVEAGDALVGACTRSRTRKMAAMTITTTSMTTDDFDFFITQLYRKIVFRRTVPKMCTEQKPREHKPDFQQKTARTFTFVRPFVFDER